MTSASDGEFGFQGGDDLDDNGHLVGAFGRDNASWFEPTRLGPTTKRQLSQIATTASSGTLNLTMVHQQEQCRGSMQP